MLTFAPFTGIVCTNLTITDDEVEEEDEVFMIEVSSLTERATSDRNPVLVTIKDDDCELSSVFLCYPTPVVRRIKVILGRCTYVHM